MLNARAVHYGIVMGLAFDCEIAPRSIFHRKNYFYPDNPKAYQISQYDIPLCLGGQLGDVRLHRIHLEEDAAKLIHVGESGRIHGSSSSIVDFNRGGTPLAEIVSEPDIRSAEQAREWLTLLRVTLRQLGVSDVNMEEGSLRCDANVSIRPVGSEELGTKTELKNMNSFRFVAQGINAEIERQTALLEAGETVSQETLHFDPASGRLTPLRSKEEAHDYRYFPEPDLVPLVPTEQMIQAGARRAAGAACGARRALPARLGAAGGDRAAVRLPARAGRLLRGGGERGRRLGGRRDLGQGRAALAPARRVRPGGVERPADHARQAGRPRADGGVTRGAGRQVLDRMVGHGGDPAEIVEAEGLGAMGDDGELAAIVARVIEEHPDIAERVRGGNPKAIGALVGPVMKETKGRADGGEVNRLLREQLGV